MSVREEDRVGSETRLRDFIEDHAAKVAPLETEMNLAYWDATITGEEDEFDRYSELETRIKEIYADPEDFGLLKKIRDEGNVEAKLLRRQLEVLFLYFQGNQIEPALMREIVSRSAGVEKKFNEYRGIVDGKEVTSNDISDILRTEIDSARRRKAWEAYKAVGPQVRDEVLELVELRNRAAGKLGFSDYYVMSLTLIEQVPAKIRAIFEDLADKTQETFLRLMDRLNRELSKRYGVDPDELMPWHYEDPFFQEAPATGQTDLDLLYDGVDLESLVSDFFRDAGIDPADIMARSDLYEKKGKMQHAYCTDIDREGDIRILANLRPNDYWAGVLLHEMGHAVYNKYIDPELPWALRGSAHSFTTEAIAQLFGRLIRNPAWLHHTLGVPREKLAPITDELVFRERLEMLVFARWTMVVTHFERELYADPDQDLNKLWWDRQGALPGAQSAHRAG